MIKHRFLLILLLSGFHLCFGNLFAQDNMQYHQWRIKLFVKPEKLDAPGLKTLWHANTQFSFMPTKHFEGGLSAGLRQQYGALPGPGGNLVLSKLNIFRYEGIANLHLLPFIMDTPDLRLELYLAGKVGAEQYYNMNYDKKTGARFFLGAGASYYLTRNIGAFAEYGYRRSFKSKPGVDNKIDFLFGLTIKF